MDHTFITVYQVPVKVFIFYNANIETSLLCDLEQENTAMEEGFSCKFEETLWQNNLGQVKKQGKSKYC